MEKHLPCSLILRIRRNKPIYPAQNLKWAFCLVGLCHTHHGHHYCVPRGPTFLQFSFSVTRFRISFGFWQCGKYWADTSNSAWLPSPFKSASPASASSTPLSLIIHNPNQSQSPGCLLWGLLAGCLHLYCHLTCLAPFFVPESTYYKSLTYLSPLSWLPVCTTLRSSAYHGTSGECSQHSCCHFLTQEPTPYTPPAPYTNPNPNKLSRFTQYPTCFCFWWKNISLDLGGLDSGHFFFMWPWVLITYV